MNKANNYRSIELAQRLSELQNAIKEQALACNRPADSVRLMAVSKNQPWSDVEILCQLGVGLIGENRAQEMLMRFPNPWPFPQTQTWFIGHLQKNKVRKVLPYIQGIQSIDNSETLELVNQECKRINRTIPVYLEVNTTGESTKFGVKTFDELCRLAQTALNCPQVCVEGLMTLGPLAGDDQATGAAFARLRTWADIIREQYGLQSLRELSMGMSQDWPIAVAEGATIVRLGTALFGARK